MEEVSPRYQAEGLHPQHCVSTKIRCMAKKVFTFRFDTQASNTEVISCLNRHVKGRVLVALADGTIAIFHRAIGKSTCQHSLWMRKLVKEAF